MEQTYVAFGPVLELHGELTIRTARERKTELLAGLDQHPPHIDLSGITHIDGAGLQLLLLARREADRQPLPFEHVVPSPCVHAALALVRLGHDLRPLSPRRVAGACA